MHRTIQELSDDIKAGKERIYTLHELNEKNKELKAEAEQLRKDLRIASTQRDVQQDCNKNWIKRYDELKTESDKFKKARDTLEGHLGYSESKNRGLNVQCIDFADKIHELKAEAEQLRKAATEKSSKGEYRMHRTIEELLDGIKGEYRMHRTIEELLDDIETDKERIHALHELNEKNKELKAEAEQLKKQNRNMINVLNDENDLLLENEQLKADLRIANKNWIKRYDELKTESNKLEEDNEKLRNTGFEYLYIEMTDKNKELKAENEKLRNTGFNYLYIEMTDKNKELKEENKQLEAKIDNAIEINAMAIKDNKQLGAKIDELKGCNREWITMYEKLEEEAEQLKKENKETGYTCATLKREFVNTCSELRAENDRLIRGNHVWKLTDRCTELKKANNEMGDMCAELRAENSKLEEEGHTSRIDLEHSIKRNEKLEAELKELKGGDSD